MKRILLASVFSALPLAAHAADLEPVKYTWIEDNAPAGRQAVVTFSLSATYFDMDAANGFSAGLFDETTGDFIGQPDNGFSFQTWGISGDVEAWIPSNASRYFVGGLEGAWVERDQSSELVVNSPDALGYLKINGETNGGDYITDVTVGTSSSGKYYRVAGLAGIGMDVAAGAKVGVGAYVAYSELDLDTAYTFQDIGFPNMFDENVATWSGGLALVGESRHEVMPGVGVFFKGRAAALYANGELDANQSNGFLGSVSTNDSATEFAGLVEGQVGFDLALGSNAKISIFGGASWRNDVFEIVNPRAGTGDLIADTFAPAHLKQTDLVEYSAGGKVEFSF